jgi:ATP-binding cassette subfamily B protein
MLLGLGPVVPSNLFTIAGPWLLKVAIDALERELRMDLILRYAGLIVLVALLAGAARYGMRELLNGISRKMERDIRNDLFDHLLRLPAAFFDAWRTGDLMSRLTNDVLADRQVAGPAIMYLVNTATISALALGLMLWIDPWLTLFAMAPMVVVPPATFYFGKKIHVRFERIQNQFAELSNYVQENLSGIRIVKAYTQEGTQREEFAGRNAEYKQRNIDLAKVWGAFQPTLTLLTGIGAVIVLSYGGRRVVDGAITLGDFVAFAFYLTLLTWPMIALGWVTNLFERGAASMGRINELVAVEPAVADPGRPIELDEPRGAVAFERVSFRYPGAEHWALRDVSFRIEPGRTVAVVGATASGKTTLTRRLLQQFPELTFSVSHTTRPRRSQEVDGADYHFVDRPAFIRGAVVPVEPGRHFLLHRRSGQQIPGQLFNGKFVERFVLVVRPDHPVPPRPHRPYAVGVKHTGIAIPGGVHPGQRHPFPIPHRGKQPIDDPFIRIRAGIVHEGFHFLRRGRQSRQIKCHPPDQSAPVGFLRRFQPFFLQSCGNEIVNRVAHPIGAGHLRQCRTIRRDKCPVPLPFRPLLNPAPDQIRLLRRKSFLCLRRRHPLLRIRMGDPPHQLACPRFTRLHNRTVVGLGEQPFSCVQPQPGFPLPLVRSVAFQAVIRENRQDIQIELNGFISFGGSCHLC